MTNQKSSNASASAGAKETKPSRHSVDEISAELRTAFQNHEVWLISDGSRGKQLKTADLPPECFTKRDLSGHDFRDACLAGQSFRNSNVCDADFRGADLYGADFSGAKGLLPGAMAGANLAG